MNRKISDRQLLGEVIQ